MAPDGSALYFVGTTNAGGVAIAYDGATGGIRWRHSDTSSLRGTAAYVGGALNAVGTELAVGGSIPGPASRDDLVELLDPATGRITLQARYNSSATGTGSEDATAMSWSGSDLALLSSGPRLLLYTLS